MLDLDTRRRVHPQVESRGALRAPLFNMLLARLRGGERSVILDLGPPRSGIIAFCNLFRCRLDIADLAQELDVLNGLKEPAVLAARAEALLPPRHEEAVDVVFCWDLLNYLQRPALTALMRQVAARTRAGTQVHALIVYSATRMPARPGTYAPVFEPAGGKTSEVRLASMPASGEEVTAPRYTPDDLGRCLYGYHLERGVLLNNGMQEFLFRL